MLTVLAVLMTLAVLVHTIRPFLAGGVAPEQYRSRLKQVLVVGAVAWALCHLAAVHSCMEGARRISSLGPGTTPKDLALAALYATTEAWWGTALLALCLGAAGGLVMARRGRERRAVQMFLFMGAVVLLFCVRGATRYSSLVFPTPVPSQATSPVLTGGGATYVPEEELIVVSCRPFSPVELTGRPWMLLLEIPAGIVVALGLTSVLRVLARRRAWPCPPDDALLLLGVAAALCVSVLFIEIRLLEAAEVLVRLGPRAPSTSILVDDFLHASAPAAAVLWAGLTVFSLGLLDRWRVQDRRVDGGEES